MKRRTVTAALAATGCGAKSKKKDDAPAPVPGPQDKPQAQPQGRQHRLAGPAQRRHVGAGQRLADDSSPVVADLLLDRANLLTVTAPEIRLDNRPPKRAEPTIEATPPVRIVEVPKPLPLPGQLKPLPKPSQR